MTDQISNIIGYELWIEREHNGNFVRVYDGKYQSGINYFNATGLTTGNSYRFKVASINYNGAGAFSEPLKVYSCLPPDEILPPAYVSSTETAMTLDWTQPINTNGCPLDKFILMMDDGAGSAIDIEIGEYEPQVSQVTLTSPFGAEDKS